MKCLALASCVLLASPTLLAAQSAASSAEEQIAEALLPLPEDLSSGAMVVAYDENGTRTVLREGTNGIFCTPNEEPPPAFTVYCRPIATLEAIDAFHEWLAEGKSMEESFSLLSAAQEAGRLPSPEHGTIWYRVISSDGEEMFLAHAIWIPNATAESTGLSAEPKEEHPWLMLAGTPNAHVMLPKTPFKGSSR